MKKTTTWTAALCAALLALHVVGCEHDSASVAVESVTVNPPVLTLKRGVTERVTATVLPDNADDKTVTWRSSDPSFATVDDWGMVTAHKVGTAIITARAGGKEATCAVTVPPASVESLSFDKDTLLLSVGTTGSPGMAITWDGIPDETVTPTIWWSSDPSVATVDWGMVTAIAEGTAIITVQVGDKKAECTVTVQPEQPEALIAVESITLDKTTLTLTRGNEAWVGWGITPQNAHNQKILWSSSDPSVATVGDDGKVTAVTAGTAIITATTEDGGKTATCEVTVNPIPVENIWILYCPPTLKRGTTGRIEVQVIPSYADATVRWSSSDPSVATVSDDGMVTAVEKGTATITAEAGGKRTERQITVTVDPIYVTSLSLAPETLRLKPGTTRTLTATVTPDNADDKTVVWSSSDPSVATVGNDGTVTAHALGTTNINAACGNFWVTCRVTVSETLVEVERITLNTDSLTLTRGDTAQLTATVTPDNADNNTVIWSSDNPEIASVDADGTVTAVGKGSWTTTYITARADGKEATCHVIVHPIYVENVTLNKDTLTLTRGETEKLTATITPDDPDDTRIAWSSSDPSVATVGSDGTVTAEGKGTATITARAGDKEATCAVTVNPITVKSIELNKKTLTLIRNRTEKLTAKVLPDSADDKTVAWSSSDTAVATVSNDGTVTAVKAGTATITAQAGDKTATCTVTVEPIRVTNVTLNTTTLLIARGKTEKLTATVWPKDADDTTVTWSSSNPSVATVGNDGTVTAYKLGTATITATTKDGGKTATCTVNVRFLLMANGTIDDNGVLTEYSGSETTVDIPDGVTGIGERAFEKCTSLTGVTIPGSVTSIGGSAFSGCTNLTGVTIPNSVTSIGGSAFSGCTNLMGVRYGGTLADWCSITWGNATANPLSYGAVLYIGNEMVTDAVIPNSVTKIKNYAFYGYTSLTGVTIPNSVTSIGGSAFSGCKNLTGVTIPNSVTSIGYRAFSGCKNLKSVTIPNSVTSIGNYAFYGCTGLTSMTIGNGVTSIGDYAFSECTGLTGVTISNGVTNIGEYAFSGCTGLTNVTIPASVESIDQYAFKGCKGLTSVTIDNGVTSLGFAMFSGCTGLTNVTIPASVTSIEQWAFDGCTSLTNVAYGGTLAQWCANGSITITLMSYAKAYYAEHVTMSDGTDLKVITKLVIPDGVTSIGEGAFYGCERLTDVTIPSSVTSIGYRAFSGYTGLTGVTIRDGVTSIERSAFDGCTSLTGVTIPDSVTSIEQLAFYGCTSLTNVAYGGTLAQWCASRNGIGLMPYAEHMTMSDGTDLKTMTKLVIPDSVTSIGECAFIECTSLTSVTIPNSVTTIEPNAFYGCTGLTSVTIPNSVTTIEPNAFYGCTGLTDVTIPGSVTSIKWNAFYKCTGLTDVHYEGTKEEWGKIQGISDSGLADKNITFAK